MLENGGPYPHAGIWVAMACAELGDARRAWEVWRWISPIAHGASPAAIETDEVKPSVVAADVCAVAPHIGRGGWTWCTGAAARLYRLIVESLLRVRLEGDRLRMAPRVVRSDGCRVDPERAEGWQVFTAFTGEDECRPADFHERDLPRSHPIHLLVAGLAEGEPMRVGRIEHEQPDGWRVDRSSCRPDVEPGAVLEDLPGFLRPPVRLCSEQGFEALLPVGQWCAIHLDDIPNLHPGIARPAQLGELHQCQLRLPAPPSHGVNDADLTSKVRANHRHPGLFPEGTLKARFVGESAASLERYNVPIVEATTSSLEALRALRRGDVARERGQTRLALDLYREAVTLDPDFALALSRRGSVTQIGGTEAECRESLERAFALRQRVALPERLEIEASYHRYVTGDQAKVVDSLELLTRTYPRRALFRRGLAVEQLRIGRYEAALAEALEAQRLEPNSAMNLATVGSAYLYLNRIADARATAEQALALGGVHPWLHVILLQCGLAADDRALLARERVWAAEHPDVATSYTAEVEAEEAMSRGRLQDAIGFLRQYEVWATSSEGPLIAARLRLWMAWFEALAGHRAQALHRLDDEIRRGLLPELKIDTVDVLVALGEFERAARVLDGIEGARPVTAQPEATFIRAYRAAIDASQGRTDQALARLAPLEPFDLGFDYGFIPLFERARVYCVAGNWTMARAAFEKILAHPTISGRQFIPLAQLGLARTLARSGDAAGSRRTYEQFFERWKNADPDLPVLGQARREYKALAK